MATSLHVLQYSRIACLFALEQPVLLGQRGDVPCRLSDQNDKSGIGEEPPKVGEARQVVIALGNITPATAYEQHLLDVVAVKALGDGVPRLVIEHLGSTARVRVFEEMHPQDLLHGLRAVRSDQDAVLVGPLRRRRIATIDLREGTVPAEIPRMA